MKPRNRVVTCVGIATIAGGVLASTAEACTLTITAPRKAAGDALLVVKVAGDSTGATTSKPYLNVTQITVRVTRRRLCSSVDAPSQTDVGTIGGQLYERVGPFMTAYQPSPPRRPEEVPHLRVHGVRRPAPRCRPTCP